MRRHLGDLSRAVLGRANAHRLGIRGVVPLGSRVSARGEGVAIGDAFFASGPVWIETVREYEGDLFTPSIEVGANVRTSPRLHLSAVKRIEIGEWVLFGENVFVADHQHGTTAGDHPLSPGVAPSLRRLDGISEVIVGARCHLGNNVVVLPGARIGDGSIIGANSVVRGSIPPGSVAVGAPARVVRRWDQGVGRWLRVQDSAS